MKIQGKKNGPYVIMTEGKYVLRIRGEEKTVDQQVVALCRCGASRNKPFCDGSHKEAGFQADEFELEIS